MSNRTEATKRKPRQRATGRLPLLRLFSTPPRACKRDSWDGVLSAQMYPALLEN